MTLYVSNASPFGALKHRFLLERIEREASCLGFLLGSLKAAAAKEKQARGGERGAAAARARVATNPPCVLPWPPLRCVLGCAHIPFSPSPSLFTMFLKQKLETEEQLRKAKELAEGTVELQRAFIGHMSHELRTPLNAVMAYCSLVLEGGGLNAVDSEYIGSSLTSASALLGVIDQVLEVRTPSFPISSFNTTRHMCDPPASGLKRLLTAVPSCDALLCSLQSCRRTRRAQAAGLRWLWSPSACSSSPRSWRAQIPCTALHRTAHRRRTGATITNSAVFCCLVA